MDHSSRSTKWRRLKRAVGDHFKEVEFNTKHVRVAASSNISEDNVLHVEKNVPTSHQTTEHVYFSHSSFSASSDDEISPLSSSSVSSDCSPEVTLKNVTDLDAVAPNILPESVSLFLFNWYKENPSVTLTALTKLLKGLKKFHPELPNDARTLLQTPRTLELKKMGCGQFFNFGIKNSILKNMPFKYDDISQLTLKFHIDGMQIYKSNKTQFWPILCQIVEDPLRIPFVVSIFCGKSKPTIDEYLFEFVSELSDLLENKLEHNNKRITITVRCFICDAPARAFVKCIYPHNAYNGCDRCIQHGQYYGRVTFPDINSPDRTDESFENLTHSHHKGISPLIKLKLGLITLFPQDSMHLVDLGVMRKLIYTWMGGKRSKSHLGKISQKLQSEISEFMIKSVSYWPSEFSRRPRPLAEIDYWKATEFRQFLLYLGPICLKSALSEPIYSHFLLLSVSMMILVNPDLYYTLNSYADSLLRAFVSHASEHYGQQFMVYNVHSLIHISSDAQRLGPLDSFSAFPFENFLYSLKRKLRKTNQPLQQVCKRIIEEPNRSQHILIQTGFTPIEKRKTPGISAGVSGIHYSCIVGSSFKLTTYEGDCCVILNNKSVFKICNFVETSNDIYIVGQKFCKAWDFFKYPCKSSNLSINRVSKLCHEYISHPVSHIKSKAILLPYKNDFISLPLIHTHSKM